MMSTARDHLQRQDDAELLLLKEFEGTELEVVEYEEQDRSALDMDVDEDSDIALAECDGEGSEAYYDGEGRQAPGEGEGRQAPGDGEGRQALDEGEGREARTLEQAILNQIIYVQSVCDAQGAGIGLQDFLMKQFLGGFTSTGQVAEAQVNLDHQPLGLLMSQLPVGWDGTLEGYSVPKSWKKLMDMYSQLGMVTPERWRLCVGTVEYAHEGVVLRPSDEDCYRSGRILQCELHGVNKRDCPLCSEKCPKCRLPRKKMKAFDYLPIGPQLSLIMQSKMFCHEILEMWRNNGTWMGKSVEDVVNPIKNFWDGMKVRINQDFWNPSKEWELPIICPQPNCKTSHKAFPRKCDELLDPRSWDENLQAYKFLCRKCRHSIVAPKSMCQVRTLVFFNYLYFLPF